MAYLAPPAIADIKAALRDRDPAARERALIAIADAEASIATADQIAAAIAEHGADNIQVDEDAGTSPTDDGTWVQAWVFVEEESEVEDEDEE